MMKYILMHREIKVAEIELDELSHITNIYEVYAEEHFLWEPLENMALIKLCWQSGGQNVLYLQAVQV